VPRLTTENRKWWILVTMTGALSMILIDETVVSVALPTIERDLDMSQTGLQWVVNAYLLALAALVAVGGRLGEMLGHARVFKIGAIVFIAASTACGFAQSEALLIASRAVQGIGAALMIPPSGAIVINTFNVSERGRAMGIYAGISMIFLALGPLVGGVLTQGVTWRAVFWVNLPIGLLMLALAHLTLERDEPDASARLDLVGAFTLVPGLAMIVLGLMQAQQWGWGSVGVVALLGVGAVLVVAFILVERRASAPLVQLGLFRSRNFSIDNAVLALVQFALTGLTVFGAIYVQQLLGYGPIGAGLSLLPLTAPLLVIAPRAGKLYDRVGPRALVGTGALLSGAGLGWCAAVLDKFSYPWLLPGYVAMGIGLALVMTPASTDAMNAAAARFRGEASGVMQTMRQVGGTVGLAVMGTIVATVQSDKLTSLTASIQAPPAQKAELGHRLAEAHGNPDALTGVAPQLVDATKDALVSGISSSYWVGAATLLAGGLLAWGLLRRVRAADAEAPAVKPPVTPGAHPALGAAAK
jgi:EmrB/QacA subfamily drug resistance transporter